MKHEQLYPLKFEPIIKSPLWGGKKLFDVLNKPSKGLESSGESWEISGVEGDVSIVINGPLKGKSLVDLIGGYQGQLVGNSVYNKFGTAFPLLIKYIDANQDLSIQVHPNDELAKKRHNSFGKTEMWYVLGAESNSSLISGFNKATNKKEYLEYFESGRIMDLLNREEAKKDDVFFLPAGRVHTIGKGLLIAEIQQTSDITYRIYDFNRVDKEGKRRELHVEEAIDAIDFNFYNDYKTEYNKSVDQVELASCSYFTTNRLRIKSSFQRDYSGIDSFKILMIISGKGQLKTGIGENTYSIGDTFLIPANLSEITIDPASESTLLEVYLPS